MRKVYEIGDVFKYINHKDKIEYCMIVATDESLIYKLINLADSCVVVESMDEENLTKFINNEGIYTYIGQACY